MKTNVSVQCCSTEESMLYEALDQFIEICNDDSIDGSPFFVANTKRLDD